MFARHSPPSTRGFATCTCNRPAGEGLVARLKICMLIDRIYRSCMQDSAFSVTSNSSITVRSLSVRGVQLQSLSDWRGEESAAILSVASI